MPLYKLPLSPQINNLLSGVFQPPTILSKLHNIRSSAKFAGITSTGWIPPDPNIAVGPNHILEWVNTQIAAFNKTGQMLSSQTMTNLWTGFKGNCALLNNRNMVNGDGVVEYDRAADRWVVAQMVESLRPNAKNTVNAECIAVSTSGDPTTGSWYRYEFDFNPKKGLIDYEKISVWPDAYYFSANLFSQTFLGSLLCGYDRANMLLGRTASAQCFYQSSASGGAGLPADLLGSNPPPSGSPGYFLQIAPSSSLLLQKFLVDWVNVSNTKLIGPITLAVNTFTDACNGGTCIPQPKTTQQLDSLGDRLMFRLVYRHFSDHESLLANHSITTGNPGQQSGVRWYEIRDPNGTPTVYQQGTYAPLDGISRWMGGIAIDQYGNIGLGYSASSTTLYPSIYTTGRSINSITPPGVMDQAETHLQVGGGSQTGISRWGDYSSMAVDPNDDCTFWYVNEYYPITAPYSWSTAIGSFYFKNTCLSNP